MLLVRLAALLQVAFLPGYLLLRASGRLSQRPLEALLHAFAVSLVANYFLVFALTAAGIFRPGVLYVLFGAEALWLLWMLRGSRTTGALLRGVGEHLRDATWGYGMALGVATLTVLGFVAAAVQNRTAVFSEWDAVVSWNRWAVDWANGSFPRQTWRYPQLLPANWSVLYVFARDQSVQSFARILQGFFPLGIALTLLELGTRKRSVRFLLAIPVLAAVFARLPGSMSSGFADVPVAFFGFLAVMTALYGEEAGERRWWLALLFACGGALTKQAGLVTLAFVWVAALAEVRRRAFALRSAAMVLAVVGSWYAFKEAQIALGVDTSELLGVFVGAHQGRGVVERLTRAGRFLTLGGTPLGIAAAAVAAALVLRSLRDAKQRLIVGWIAAPYLVLWALAYSYDLRNATLAVPFLALALVHGLPALPELRPTALQLVGAGVLGVGLLGAVGFDEGALRSQQLARRRTIGDAALDGAIYGALDPATMVGKVVTGYQLLGFLPGFEGRVAINGWPFSVADLEEAERDAGVGYVMYPPDWTTAEAWTVIERRLEEGRYRLLFDQPAEYGVVRLVQLRVPARASGRE